MRKEIRTGAFGLPYELRIEENGHSATNSSGCACSECRNLRAKDGRCTECGKGLENAGLLTRCVGCTASGLGA